MVEDAGDFPVEASADGVRALLAHSHKLSYTSFAPLLGMHLVDPHRGVYMPPFPQTVQLQQTFLKQYAQYVLPWSLPLAKRLKWELRKGSCKGPHTRAGVVLLLHVAGRCGTKPKKVILGAGRKQTQRRQGKQAQQLRRQLSRRK